MDQTILRHAQVLQCKRLADAINKTNAFMRMFPPAPPLTRWERVKARVERTRRAVGFWIAGYNPDDD